MYSPIEYEAWRERREELALEVARERQARHLRPARQRPRPLKTIAGRIAARMSGRPQPAR